MTPCALPQALPISCKDCPAFQRLHMSFRCCSESLNRLLNVINTTFREMTYIRWCCIDQLSRHILSVTGFWERRGSVESSYFTIAHTSWNISSAFARHVFSLFGFGKSSQ